MKYDSEFEKAKIKARITLRDTKAMLRLREAVNEKISTSKHRIYEGLDDLYTLVRLLGAFATGEYREVSFKAMVAVVAALIYFLNPMDLIPDFIATFGFLDDLTVLGFVIRTFKIEIDRFVEWEMEGKDVEDETINY